VADIIWRAAGDASTDYNWYTKRGLLSACYISTELYMLTDCSPGYADTWAALERRLQDVVSAGRAVGQAGSGAGAAVEAAGAVLQQMSSLLAQRPGRGPA
jgi:ubiquinone biosynthesis protein COQ9